jgi:protein involved in polysaccharide export with SLBB domain
MYQRSTPMLVSTGACLATASALILIGGLASAKRSQADEGLYVVQPAKVAALPARAAPPRGNPARAYSLGAGDRLKVTVIGRDDLSRELKVDEDDNVVLPPLGVFAVTGLTTRHLQQGIAEAYESNMGRPGEVYVEVVERRPFFVVGLVNKPGPHAFGAGATVLHALAAAGGVFRAPNANWLGQDVIRQTGRHAQARDELARASARRTRLAAERDGLGGPGDFAPASIAGMGRVVPTSAHEENSYQFASEEPLLRRRMASLDRERSAQRMNIELAQQEIAALESQRQSLAEQRQMKAAHLADLRQLEARGLTTRLRVLDQVSSVAAVDREDRELSSRIAQTKRLLAAAERERDMFEYERKNRLDEEIGVLSRQITSLEVELTSSDALIQQMTGLPASALKPNFEPTVRFEIVRSIAGKQVVIPAEEMTPILPGDVLKVVPASR